MDIRRRVKNHNKRWNISMDSEGQFLQLRNRVINAVHQYLGQRIINDIKIDRQFKENIDFSLGREPELDRHPGFILPLNFPSTMTQTRRIFTDSYIYREIKDSKDIKQLATALQVLFWVFEYKEQELPISKLIKELRDAAELSPNTGFYITTSKKRVIFYPLGAKLLDEEVVNNVLEWLEEYPKIAKAFEEALKIYTDRDNNKYRNLLDNLRFAIEQLLKEILGNNKSLENQKGNLLSWLNQRGNHQSIINLYQQLLYYYCGYQNEAVKHNEAFSEDEIEFMIYLTGTFIRFLIQPKLTE